MGQMAPLDLLETQDPLDLGEMQVVPDQMDHKDLRVLQVLVVLWEVQVFRDLRVLPHFQSLYFLSEHQLEMETVYGGPSIRIQMV